MSKWLVAFLFTAGATTWFYTKLQRYSGNNTKQSIIASGVAGVVLYFVSVFVFGIFISS